jgi:hypothetical protein
MEILTCEITYIYGLVDPRNNEIRYIGKTIDPKNRLSGHITESKDINVVNYRARWLRKLTKIGLKPEIIFLRTCSSDEYEKYETEYIQIYSNNRLTNSDESGQGNKNRKREVLNRQSENSGRKVYQYDLNGNFIKEYRSTRYTANELGLNHGNIARCCNGIFKHTGGYIFKYEMSNILKLEKPNAVKKVIIEVDLDGLEVDRWNSIMECSRSVGIDNGNLSRVCNGIRDSIKGRYFKFL